MRSAPALSKIEDMNTFILFYKNQSEFEAITEYDDLDVSLQVGLLLESLEAFEAETAGLAEAMQSKLNIAPTQPPKPATKDPAELGRAMK